MRARISISHSTSHGICVFRHLTTIIKTTREQPAPRAHVCVYRVCVCYYGICYVAPKKLQTIHRLKPYISPRASNAFSPLHMNQRNTSYKPRTLFLWTIRNGIFNRIISSFCFVISLRLLVPSIYLANCLKWNIYNNATANKQNIIHRTQHQYTHKHYFYVFDYIYPVLRWIM